LRSESEPASTLPERIVAVGTSAGGLDALSTLLRSLPPDFSYPLLVVQHLARNHASHLPVLLQSHTRLRVKQAEDGEGVRAGHVYVAPPNRHMEVEGPGRIVLQDNPPVRFVRPSVDVLFASLAHAVRERAIAVVLTGAGSDGARGVRAVADAGGLVIAQDPAASRNLGMPQSAIATGAVDHVLPLANIGPFLLGIAGAGSAP
jgi:two-component system chemotaxis response regulator CheB